MKSEFAETANAHELRSKVIAANIAPDKEAQIILSASQQATVEVQSGHTDKRKRQDQQLQMTLFEQAQRVSERLAQQIAAMESAFEKEMGHDA